MAQRAAAVPASPTPIPTPDPVPAPSRRGRLWIAGAAALAWIILLGTLALTSANPPTLNAYQIADADYIVIAQPGDAPNELVVESELKQQAQLERVRVVDLAEAKLVAGQRYIVPLSGSPDGEMRVTQSLHAKLAGNKEDRAVQLRRPLVYPATDETLKQLDALLKAPKPPGEWEKFLAPPGRNRP